MQCYSNSSYVTLVCRSPLYWTKDFIDILEGKIYWQTLSLANLDGLSIEFAIRLNLILRYKNIIKYLNSTIIAICMFVCSVYSILANVCKLCEAWLRLYSIRKVIFTKITNINLLNF